MAARIAQNAGQSMSQSPCFYDFMLMHICQLDSGTSFLFTSQRIKSILHPSHQNLPPMPDSVDGFMTTGLNMRPAFFGCFPTQNPPEYPLVISLPNSPPISGNDPVTK